MRHLLAGTQSGAARSRRAALKRPVFIARQSARPSGLLGRLIAWIMAHETATENALARDLLAPRPTDRILEIGFGHGYQLRELARAAPEGRVSGVDHSEDMLHFASRRLAALIAAGRVEIACSDSRRLPHPDGTFDRALAVHTVYFWSEPLAHLREASRVLRPGGRLVLGFRSRLDPRTRDFPDGIYTFYAPDEIAALLRSAGFVDVSLSEPAPGFHLACADRPRDAGVQPAP